MTSSSGAETCDQETLTRMARFLIYLATDVRARGDVEMVLLDEHGVGPAGTSLAGCLEIVAMNLDYDTVIADVKEDS